MTVESTWSKEFILDILSTVTDPEIPVLTVEDLGVIREINISPENGVEVVITPTYSGCPAMKTIEVNILATLQEAGISPAQVRTILAPPWTTDWISDAGRQKLREYGIAPPVGSPDKGTLFSDAPSVDCPHCGSPHTEMISQFGSTPCKSLYKCSDCLEPFDYFKCH
jgi:ring-1,2-phenylacetyl-CoA epoxidase subunit PaaD